MAARIDAEAAWLELPALSERIDRARADLERLYARRREFYAVLLAAGHAQAAVGRQAGVTSTAVGLAVGKTYVRKQSA